MKRIFLFIFLLISIVLENFACTTFVIHNQEELVFGRNLDWVSDNGLIVVNKRSVKKRALVFPPDQPAVWTSKYGSVTFNQFGKEFPYGGINEKGLVVEIMVVGGEYPKQDQRKALNELQWVQYQLDNCQTVEEVIASDQQIRIAKVSQQIHFLVCDSTGNVAAIDFINGKQVVHTGEDLIYPVLENSTYEKSLLNRASNKKCRFNTTIDLIENYPKQQERKAVDYSFDILDKVKLDGSWSIVYDVKNRRVFFHTASNRSRKQFKLSTFDFGCKSEPLVYDLQADDLRDISTRFEKYTSEKHQAKFDDGLKTNGLYLPESVYQMFIDYPEDCLCEEG